MRGSPVRRRQERKEEFIGESGNRLIADHDPTWHGEVGAIRDTCKKAGTHDLSGSVLFMAGYPCPMCYCLVGLHRAHLLRRRDGRRAQVR